MSEQDECDCDQCGENPCKEMWTEEEKNGEDKFASLRREPTFKVLSRHEVIMKHREGQVNDRMKGGPEIIKKV